MPLFAPPLTHLKWTTRNFTNLLISFFVSIRIHGGQEVDSRLSHQPDDALVAPLVFSA